MVTVGSILGGTFGFVRDRIGAILVWSALLCLLSLASMLLLQPLYAQQMSAAQPGAPASPFGPNMGLALLSFAVFLVVFVVLFAAVFRAILFPEQSRFAYLRVGMDELRLLATMLVLAVGGAVMLSVISAVLMILVGLAAVALGTGGSTILSALTMLILFGGWIFLAVRLSVAGPLTILQRKVVIGPAFRATRGHFWRLLGAYVVIVLLLLAIYLVVAFIQMGSILGDMLHPLDPAAHARVLAWQAAHYGFSARAVVYAIVGGLLWSFGSALQGGMAAVATAQLLDRGARQHLSEIFE